MSLPYPASSRQPHSLHPQSLPQSQQSQQSQQSHQSQHSLFYSRQPHQNHPHVTTSTPTSNGGFLGVGTPNDLQEFTPGVELLYIQREKELLSKLASSMQRVREFEGTTTGEGGEGGEEGKEEEEEEEEKKEKKTGKAGKGSDADVAVNGNQRATRGRDLKRRKVASGKGGGGGGGGGGGKQSSGAPRRPRSSEPALKHERPWGTGGGGGGGGRSQSPARSPSPPKARPSSPSKRPPAVSGLHHPTASSWAKNNAQIKKKIRNEEMGVFNVLKKGTGRGGGAVGAWGTSYPDGRNGGGGGTNNSSSGGNNNNGDNGVNGGSGNSNAQLDASGDSSSAAYRQHRYEGAAPTPLEAQLSRGNFGGGGEGDKDRFWGEGGGWEDRPTNFGGSDRRAGGEFERHQRRRGEEEQRENRRRAREKEDEEEEHRQQQRSHQTPTAGGGQNAGVPANEPAAKTPLDALKERLDRRGL